MNSRALAVQFKSDFVPLTVVQLKSTDLKKIEAQLASTLNQAPHYFAHSPVVIDAQYIPAVSALDWAGLHQLLKRYKIVPVGIKGIPMEARSELEQYGLMYLNYTERPPTPQKPSQMRPTRVITQPVRAGTQIYARDCDLVILSSVNVGAECMADGNIHIYGPLRGRALAGMDGNTETHIFCKTLEAELIAIAGYYLVKDNIHAPTLRPSAMTHIYWKAEKLNIEGI